jgi:hypothetical protein
MAEQTNMSIWEQTPADGLRAADDFLVALLKYTGMQGFIEPDVGEVSSRFVLGQVRAARFGTTILDEVAKIGGTPAEIKYLADDGSVVPI